MDHARLTAIYPTQDQADRAAVRLREDGVVPRAAVRVSSPRDDAAAARAEQREESEVYTGSRGLLTDRGIFMGAGLGALAGAMLGIMVGAFTVAVTETAPLSDGGFMLAAIGSGIVAGSVAGALIGAFGSFRLEQIVREEQMHDDFVVTVEAPDVSTMDSAQAILQETGPRHIERQLPSNTRRAS